MNKETIRQKILLHLEEQLKLAIHAANEAKSLATHEESIAETQYDTVGLEASYLAHGQSMRVAEFQEAIQTYRNLPLFEFTEDTPIRVTALITVTMANGELKCFFIGPTSGGLELVIDGQKVVLITPDAPLSKKLLGLYEGDTLDFPGQGVDAEILTVR